MDDHGHHTENIRMMFMINQDNREKIIHEKETGTNIIICGDVSNYMCILWKKGIYRIKESKRK